jgi:hypothetical protein
MLPHRALEADDASMPHLTSHHPYTVQMTFAHQPFAFSSYKGIGGEDAMSTPCECKPPMLTQRGARDRFVSFDPASCPEFL